MSETLREAHQPCVCGAQYGENGYAHGAECPISQTPANYPEWYSRQIARERELQRAIDTINRFGRDGGDGLEAEPGFEMSDARAIALGNASHTFTRADVLDLATAANDARQLAILTPLLAEEATARAARYDDLAARIAALVAQEEQK
jgi:hypothetical protein